ncbi:MAG: bifunctional DNA primase/polymerase [Alphaproteobacteria bacterium]|nr:bifunctional DNA primase/polymerase [Alphaproteobacteria bacterium]
MAQVIKSAPFQKLVANGYLEYMIPIAPPDAKILHGSALRAPGKMPGKYLSQKKAWCGFPRWQDHVTTLADIAEWATWPNVGIGIRTGRLIGIDIDILHPDLAAGVALDFQMEFGFAPCRTGCAPKKLLLYRLDGEPCQKAILDFQGNYSGRIEVLGAGNQFVAFGTHPYTCQPYKWDGGSPANITFNNLPVLSNG